MTPLELLLTFAAIAAGGLLKGATGAGAPIVAVPILALIHDVPYAVAVFVVPNLMTNVWQGWQFRKNLLPGPFTLLFAGGGAIGAVAGTYMLAFLPPRLLLMAVGVVVVVYIGFRLSKPHWSLAFERAVRLSLPIGIIAGILQGASGVSAPVSLTFLNTLRLERPAFIATVSMFFLVVTIPQIPVLAGLGILTGERILHGGVALAILLAFMPIGSRLARHIPKDTFDKIILALLGVIAAKILVSPFL